MAMPPPGNVIPSDNKLQFPPPPPPPAAAAVAGNWIPDGRDGFISWIRGEFAAANDIINSLCQHLIAIGDQNEYEAVISTIQHRQIGWSQAIFMQHYFPVVEVSYALQEVAWKRQQKMSHQHHHHHSQRHYNSDGKFGGRRSGGGFNRQHHGGGGGGYRGGDSVARNGHYSNNSDCHIDRGENREEAKLGNDEKVLSVAEEKKGNGFVA